MKGAGKISDYEAGRRYFIGGSDARIIMGDDEAALIRLWKEKRGEVEPEDLSGNLIVQLGLATEKLNRRWYQANTGRVVTDVQMWRRHPTLPWLAATLDGRVEGGEVFESKVHAALAILGGSRRNEARGSAATQHVGRGSQRGDTFDYQRRRPMGSDQNPCRSALPTSHRHCRAQILALR